ncbi:putative transcription factor ssDNA-binding-TF family [Helianthus annuus]|uniref:Putative transcriptional coactivator p15 (PC4) family protein (KELP) n=1 Tax=Helianthus annuus TaxID=4232 RepID=A0A251RL86_HELAN|nr:RNA polymerase II transcriptional coactivator KELP [Helianthus annuus]KAF5753485.1 putative transcription coactivator TCoAp15 family [Helianthus annuus]KAJ0427558.1 putative transcription factor ssDNA-binding-TF family [Helianthus annuus]KAJ0431374.1 putative transcription factor ssDNA-binding-TF family [Helianthus annuus]KAJ0445843.1 putative transcription factor ssDNA-binding-TF family [Helianthus annuus]KAJ0630807.1 putative transcription factor ssDNA-binding-TF family [Helianthus annuus
MDSALAKEIEEAVLQVLNNSDMDSTTEYQVRKLASEQIGIDLSEPSRKKLVRSIVQTYLEEQQAKAEAEEKVTEEGEPVEEEEEEDSEDDKKKRKGDKEYDDEGDLIVCRLSDKRRVTLTEFRGKSLVSIREYYKRDGKELPSSKGISLTAEQWSVFSKNVPAIEKAIKKLDGRY